MTTTCIVGLLDFAAGLATATLVLTVRGGINDDGSYSGGDGLFALLVVLLWPPFLVFYLPACLARLIRQRSDRREFEKMADDPRYRELNEYLSDTMGRSGHRKPAARADEFE